MSRASLIRQQVLLMRSLERPFAKAVRAEKNRYILAEAKAWGEVGAFSPSLFQEHQALMAAIYQNHTGKAVTGFGKLTLGGLKCACDWCRETKDGTPLPAIVFSKLARSWMAEYGAAKVKRIAETTRQDLRRALIMAEEEGDTLQETRTRLKAVGLLSTFRASVIARTETHNAGMFAASGVAEQVSADTGIQLVKEWMAVEDDRTREAHMLADGQTVELRGEFTVGGELMEYPGDPGASPENVINCRCVIGTTEA